MDFAKTYRDLTILPVSDEKRIVIACDSSAGIGEKEEDIVLADPAITAAYCLRVPLMELFCFGAKPIAVIDLIGNDYDTTGKKMLTGLKAELKAADLFHISLNGSTEENMPTKTTSLGITVLAEISASQKTFKMKEACGLFQLGHPYVGELVLKNQQTIFSYSLVKLLKKQSGVLDMLPVGSKGIRYEAQLMAEDSDYYIDFFEEQELDCSAGPATVVLLAVKPEAETALLAEYSELKKIGEFKKR